MLEKIKRFILSLITDKDWDGDAAKVTGFVLVLCGIFGFFLSKTSFEFMIITGGTMITSGKWSTQG